MTEDITSLIAAEDGLTTGLPDLIVLGTGSSKPGGVETVLEYNGTLLNFRNWIDTYIISSIDGLADPDVRDAREVNPSRHGETHFDAYYGGRTIVLTGKIRAHTINKLRDMQMGLKQIFGDISQEKPLRFRNVDPAKEVFINCKKSQPIVMAETQQNFQAERDFQITLRASDPFFYSSIEYSDSDQWGDHEKFTQETEFLGPINISDNPRQATSDGTTLSPTGTLDNLSPQTRGAWSTGQMAGLTESYLIVKSRSGNRFPISAGNEVGAAVWAGLDNVAAWTGWTLRLRVRYFNSAGVSLGVSNLSLVNPADSSLAYLFGTSTALTNSASFQIEVFAEKSTTGLARRIILDSIAVVINPPAAMEMDSIFYGGKNGAWLGTPDQSISRARSFSGWADYEATPLPAVTEIQARDGHLEVLTDNSIDLAFWRLEASSTIIADGRYSIRYKTGATVQHANTWLDIGAKYRVAGFKWLYGRVRFDNATAQLSMAIGGTTPTSLVSASDLPAALTPNTEYVMTLSFDGNDVVVTHSKADGTQLKTINATLAGGEATDFGVGVTGRYGFLTHFDDMSGWLIDDNMFEPSATEDAAVVSVANEGNVNASPIIRVWGTLNAATNNGPACEIRSVRSNGSIETIKTMKLNAYGGSKIAIPADHYIEIDSQKRTVREHESDGTFVRNAFEQLDVTSEWLDMEPGVTDFELETFAPSAPKLEILYRHAYL